MADIAGAEGGVGHATVPRVGEAERGARDHAHEDDVQRVERVVAVVGQQLGRRVHLRASPVVLVMRRETRREGEEKRVGYGEPGGGGGTNEKVTAIL